MLASLGAVARAHLPAEAGRVALVSNPRVFGLYGADAVARLRGAGFSVPHWLMGDGEAVTWLLGEEAEHGPLAAGELGRARGRGGHTLTVAQPTNPGFATNAPERSNLGHNGGCRAAVGRGRQGRVRTGKGRCTRSDLVTAVVMI